jgi:hypothetical protein
MTFAEVAVNAAAPLRHSFTYRVPEGLTVLPGQAVYVPFGRRTLQGVVMGLASETAVLEVREVEAVIDPQPMLSTASIVSRCSCRPASSAGRSRCCGRWSRRKSCRSCRSRMRSDGRWSTLSSGAKPGRRSCVRHCG